MPKKDQNEADLLPIAGGIIGALVAFILIYMIGASISHDMPLAFLSALIISAWFSMFVNDWLVRYFDRSEVGR